MEIIKIVIGSVLVYNIVLFYFFGICPFIGVSTKLETAFGMGGAVTFVMVISSIITYLINVYLLIPYEIEFMNTVTYILVIASLVQLVEIVLKKASPPLYQALGIFLPLITTNCAILGVALQIAKKDYNLIESVFFAVGNSIGFSLALVLFAGLRSHLELVNVPVALKGVPIAFVVAGILALAFMGFAGIV